MTTITKESGRLAWLTSALGEQRDIVASLLRRLTCFSSPGSLDFSMFRKFMKTLEQISLEKDRESEILSRIQAIESQHRFQRTCKKLKHAEHEQASPKAQNPEIISEPERENSNSGWLLVVGLILLMSRRGPKPQE